MIGSVEAVTHSMAALETRSGGQEPSLQPSSERMSAAFARDVVAAADQLGTPIASTHLMREMSPPPAAGGTLSDRLTAQAGALVDHLRTLDTRATPQPGVETTRDIERTRGAATGAAEGGNGMPVEKAMIGDTVAQMERAYMFAIEATLASRGSTEASKIFNTLLKGQ